MISLATLKEGPMKTDELIECLQRREQLWLLEKLQIIKLKAWLSKNAAR